MGVLNKLFVRYARLAGRSEAYARGRLLGVSFDRSPARAIGTRLLNCGLDTAELSKVIGFEWDEGNSRKNEQHGVSMAEAEQLFFRLSSAV